MLYCAACGYEGEPILQFSGDTPSPVCPVCSGGMAVKLAKPQPQPAPHPQPQPSILQLARERLKQIRAELRRLHKLEREAAELQRLIQAARGPARKSNVTPLRKTS